MRIAWFSPLPPMPSGIADYSFELLPFVGEGAEVEAFCPSAGRRSVQAPAGIPVMDPSEFDRRAGHVFVVSLAERIFGAYWAFALVNLLAWWGASLAVWFLTRRRWARRDLGLVRPDFPDGALVAMNSVHHNFLYISMEGHRGCRDTTVAECAITAIVCITLRADSPPNFTLKERNPHWRSSWSHAAPWR